MQELETAQNKIQVIKQDNADLTKWFDNIQIQTVEQQKNYEEILGSAKIAYKKAKAEQDGILEPLQESERKIRALFKPLLDKYSTAITTITSLLNQWRITQKTITDEQILQRAQDYWTQRKEADKTGEVVALPDLAVSPIPNTSRHNMGSTNYRPKIVVNIISPSLIPRKYCTPSESLLRIEGEGALKRGEPMPLIEGAEIKVEYIAVSRPAK